MVHSSLSSLGTVEGGAETVMEALLQALGNEGTLVVPTFTDEVVARYNGFVFDVSNTPSYVGAITEAARARPDALRSHHPWHSVSAIGPMADDLTHNKIDSPWRPGSPMSQIVSAALSRVDQIGSRSASTRSPTAGAPMAVRA